MTAFSCVMAVVLLTLLIIEMVAFPLAWGGHHGVGIDLPRVNYPVTMRAANREDAVIIGIMRDGGIFFANDRTTAPQLPAKIEERLSHGAERRAYIKADARARYGTVRIVLGAVRSAGVESVGILVEQPYGPRRPTSMAKKREGQ
jgi:biopolymer transport protein ExbD